VNAFDAFEPGRLVDGNHLPPFCLQLESLQRLTRRHLGIANDRLAQSGPALTVG